MEKLERLVESLQPREAKKFLAYLQSPYFEIQDEVRKFGEGYLKAFPKLGKKDAPSEKWWKQIYPDSVKDPYNEGKWRKQKSFLDDQLVAFLQQQAFEKGKTDLQEQNLLLRELDNRRLDQDFEAVFKKAKKTYGDKPVGRESDLKELVRLWENAYNFYARREDPNSTITPEAEWISLRTQAIYRWYFFDYLMTATALENHRAMRKIDFELELPPGFADFVQNALEGKDPLFRLYALLLIALGECTLANLNTFVEAYFQDVSYLGFGEKVEIFTIGTNIYVRQYYSNPNEQMAKKLLDLYAIALQEKIIVGPDGLFYTRHFKNICTIGCHFHQIEFVTQFINDYQGMVAHDEETQNILGYCNALLLFTNKEYLQCLEKLRTLDATKYLKIEMRTLEIKAHYERGNMDVVEACITASERFLQRSPYPSHRYDVFMERLKIIRKILNLRPENRKAKEKLQQQIVETQVLDRAWLLQILEAKT